MSLITWRDGYPYMGYSEPEPFFDGDEEEPPIGVPGYDICEECGGPLGECSCEEEEDW